MLRHYRVPLVVDGVAWQAYVLTYTPARAAICALLIGVIHQAKTGR